jgi:hypothetical protein
MRLLTLLLILGVGVVFFVQNQQPVTLVFFGNLATLTLPIAGWVLLFIVAGALTSIFWQLLSIGRNSSPPPRSYRPPRSRPVSQPPSPSRTEWTPSEPPPDSRPLQEPTRSPVQTPATSKQVDWESKDFQEEWDDWREEEPIRDRPREPIRDFVREFPRQSQDDEDTNENFETRRQPERESPVEEIDNRSVREDQFKSSVFEAEQKPKTVNRTGSVYSYVYKEPKDREDRPDTTPDDREVEPKETKKSDRVYDANYRVIRPPYRDPSEPQIEETDDWI